MKRSRGLIYCIVLIALFCTGFSMASRASSSGVTTSDTKKILITGYSNKDLEVSVGEIKNLPQVKRDVVSVNSNGEKKTFSVIGGDFDALLKKLNISKDGIGGLRLYSTDGYSVEVPEAIVKSRQIVLSYLKNGAELGEDGPILIVIPEERAMYWAKMLSKIEIIKKIKKVDIECVNFVEAMGKSKIINSYKDLSGKHKAIKCSDLIKLISAKNKPNYVILKASDGLEKNETLENFNKA
jgi:DMSO/TMAO reductase YedYZ molybdopterin-dependent catalytic subunit